MLHVVPALILLIIQGPAGADRSPCYGRLPTALEALNARLEPGGAGEVHASNRTTAIASLLALGAKDPRWTAAIARFLEGAGFDALPPASIDTIEARSNAGRTVRIYDPAGPLVRKPFVTSCRFRDGPSSR